MIQWENQMKFKSIFEAEREKLLYSSRILDENFSISKEETMDEVDLTSTELEQSMRIRLRNREALYLKKLDQALTRIQAGKFGECECCGVEIDEKRLLARPTTTLCIECKEEEEMKERNHIDSRIPTSLGQVFKFKFA